MVDDEKQVVALYENRCAVCQKPFFQKRRGRLRRTCSTACRLKLYRMRHPPEEPDATDGAVGDVRPEAERQKRVPTACPVCGGPIEQPEGRGRRRKVCSESCRKKLWRQQNPRCIVCGRRFRMARHQKDQKYCSDACGSTARTRRARQQAREKHWAEMGGYRPEWLADAGSGYREEEVPWEDGAEEGEAVIRERAAEPNHEPEGVAGLDAARAQIAQQMIQAAQEEAAQAELERARKARRLAWELLEDESKWHNW